MIARIWHGRTPAEKIDDYVDYVKRTGVEEHVGVPGNRGDFILRRIDGKEAHILVVSLWDSMEAIRAYAGDDPDKAVYYPEDDAYLLEREPHVEHYEVSHAPAALR